MTIRRSQLPTDHFTIISNAWLRDEALPWAARGLLGWMASHTKDFDITEAAIIAAGPSNRDGVRSMIGALEQAGYLRRKRVSVVSGGSTVDYILTDPGETENPSLRSDGKSDPRADQAEQDVSAGQPSDGKSPPRSSLENQKKTIEKTSSSPRASRSSTATRIPEGFMPDENMRAWFVAEQLQNAIQNPRVEHEKFCDYWAGVPGVKGRKHDWPATWRNWMRSAAERAPHRPGNSLTPVSGAPRQYVSTTDGKVMQTLGLAEKFRQMEENQ